MAIKKGFLEKRLSLPAVFASNKETTTKKISRSVTEGGNKMEDGKKRFLVTINVVGSAGPIRFVVNGDENVEEVTKKALLHYAREKRAPQLGSDTNTFSLYSPHSQLGELDPLERIGSSGAWKFGLSKKHGPPSSYTTEMIVKRKANKWIPWLPKSKTLPTRKLDVASN